MKPSIPKGTRDFMPVEMIRRNYIFNTIRTIFEKYAYQPVETPSMENLSTLTGKYGEEGDRLLFKILNSGDFTKGVDLTLPPPQLAGKISEKGLRYDLTVPFARFVVTHQHEITFPFKRYQIQPVWRADRPQKGRYREFYQCDVDVIGSNSLWNEAELMKITDEVFTSLGIEVTIKVNNRKILAGIAGIMGAPEKMVDICTAIDKLDKIGKDNVIKELLEREISPEAIGLLNPVFDISGSNEEQFATLRTLFKDNETGLAGVNEVETMLRHAGMLDISSPIRLDVLLARGLNYYTGAIFEVRAMNAVMGSISGGGRYDDLTGIFGLKNMSGVGISYGAERIYDVMMELGLFPDDLSSPVKVMFLNFGDTEVSYLLPALKEMRNNGIPCELYPDQAKIAKQMQYANSKLIPYVIMAGKDEMEEQIFTLKDMESGDQKKLDLEEMIKIIKHA